MTENRLTISDVREQAGLFPRTGPDVIPNWRVRCGVGNFWLQPESKTTPIAILVPFIFPIEVPLVTSRQVQAFLEGRQQGSADSETFRNAQQATLACDKAEVLAQFETRLQVRDEEERASAIAGLAALYGVEATDTLVRWITDPSSTVRWVVCCCLHGCADVGATAALLDRLKRDTECQVRGVVADALGQIGALESLPELHQAHQTDFAVDELGHSPSRIALDAMTEVLSNWVT